MSKQQINEGLLQSLSDAVADLTERVSRSVVNVGNGHHWGTGIVWSKEGHIVTANHVVGRSDTAEITLNDGKTVHAKVVGRDPDNDLALLKADSDGGIAVTPVEVSNGRELRAGEMVFAFANMTGQKSSVTSGIVTSPSRSLQSWWGVMIEDAIITDAQLNPGYSGGPLVDASGKLIGMNVAYFASRGVAVSAHVLKERLQKLAADGKIRRGYLGIMAEPIELPEELAQKSDVKQEGALLVRSVERGTPAEAAGVSIGDIILKLNGESTEDVYDLHRLLTDKIIGSPVTLALLRGGKPTEVKVTPKEAEE
jgi:S1-C subfamily serine protease